MLSFSNFGSTQHPYCEKVRKATELLKAREPLLMVDGEMMADTAVTPEMLQQDYPFSTLKGAANVLIFPDLQSANTAYKLLMRLGGAEAIGPLLMGMSKPVYVLPRGADVEDIVNIASIAVVDAQGAYEHQPELKTLQTPVAADRRGTNQVSSHLARRVPRVSAAVKPAAPIHWKQTPSAPMVQRRDAHHIRVCVLALPR